MDDFVGASGAAEAGFEAEGLEGWGAGRVCWGAGGRSGSCACLEGRSRRGVMGYVCGTPWRWMPWDGGRCGSGRSFERGLKEGSLDHCGGVWRDVYCGGGSTLKLSAIPEIGKYIATNSTASELLIK